MAEIDHAYRVQISQYHPDKVAKLGGDGGVIALDAKGNVALEFNSPGMYRGVKLSDRPELIAIYGDEQKQ